MRRSLERMMEQPWVYRLWQAPFAERKFLPVQRYIDSRPVRRVLDVGCGPGTNASRFQEAEYVGIDINEKYLELGRANHAGLFIQADLATADLSHLGTFDTILVNSFLHHLPDSSVDDVLRRITGLLEPDGCVHILELVRPDRLSVARLMAWLDRGQYARSLASWQTRFERHFEPVVLEPYMLGGRLWAMVYFRGRAKTCISP
ncbi:MAG: class I SAM-dependent methyltransferase [Vicinamibacterales bacterium]